MEDITSAIILSVFKALSDESAGYRGERAHRAMELERRAMDGAPKTFLFKPILMLFRKASSAASTFRTSDGIVLTKWSLVSKSFAYLGEESRKLANARNDLKQLQTDLPQQDITRSTAAAELRKENAAIAEEIEKLLGGAVEENWSKLNGTLDGDLVEAERKRKVIAARKGELEKEYASEVLALKM
eukprot:g18750.t1